MDVYVKSLVFVPYWSVSMETLGSQPLGDTIIRSQEFSGLFSVIRCRRRNHLVREGVKLSPNVGWLRKKRFF